MTVFFTFFYRVVSSAIVDDELINPQASADDALPIPVHCALGVIED